MDPGWIFFLFAAGLTVVIIIIIIVLVIIHRRPPNGPTGCSSTNLCPSGQSCVNGICVASCSSTNPCPSGQSCVNGVCLTACTSSSMCPTGTTCINNVCVSSSPCGSGTPVNQLCLMNGLSITLQHVVTAGFMGICAGDVLNGGNNYCVDLGSLNFVSTSPNQTNSTVWQVTVSTDGNYIALLNVSTNQYLSIDLPETCVGFCPGSFTYGCNNPVITSGEAIDPNNPSGFGPWFAIGISDLGNFVVNLTPFNSSSFGSLGTDSSQVNDASCPNMVAANYTASDPNAQWVLSYIQ